jgi:TolA-binding protein
MLNNPHQDPSDDEIIKKKKSEVAAYKRQKAQELNALKQKVKELTNTVESLQKTIEILSQKNNVLKQQLEKKEKSTETLSFNPTQGRLINLSELNKSKEENNLETKPSPEDHYSRLSPLYWLGYKKDNEQKPKSEQTETHSSLPKPS